MVGVVNLLKVKIKSLNKIIGMLIEDLYTLKENIDQSEVKSLDCLLQVINDWPNHFDTLEEYLADIRVFLKNKNITIEAIQSKLVTLDPSKNAWEIESLTGLLDLMNNKIGNKLLKEIAIFLTSLLKARVS